MAKKKKPAKPQAKAFGRNPFRNLKGFAVSGEERVANPEPAAQKQKAELDRAGSFADEMAMLGVKRINSEDTDGSPSDESMPEPERHEPPVVNEEEQFLQAMGELQVNFSDRLPEEEDVPVASARRMKQLKQGKLVPQATLDLHGFKRVDVADKLKFFLQNAARQNLQTLLVITGRGLHSDAGEPVLRREAEHYLAHAGRKWVAEWGRAPKQYGGDGALVLFLKKQPS